MESYDNDIILLLLDDELVTEAVRNLNPRLYEAFMRKLRS